MAKNKRPKWLDAETPELLNTLKDILGEEEINQTKAQKIVDELISRIPTEVGIPSVEEAINAAKSCMDNAMDLVKAAYDHEVSLISETETEDDPTEEEEEEPEEAPKKSSKKSKKAPKVEEPEEDEDEDQDEDEEEDEEDEEEDYSDWSTKALKAECRKRGIKVTKAMGKADMVKALEADDKE